MGHGEQPGRVGCWQEEWDADGASGAPGGAAGVTGAGAGPAASRRAGLGPCPEEESPAVQVEEGTGDAEAGARQPDSLPEEPQRVSGALGGAQQLGETPQMRVDPGIGSEHLWEPLGGQSLL